MAGFGLGMALCLLVVGPSPLQAQAPKPGPQAKRPAAAKPHPPDEKEFQRLGGLARQAREGGDLEHARELYEQLVRMRPRWAEGWWYLGTVCYDQRRFVQAVVAFEKFTTLEPDNGQGWGLLGICEFSAGEVRSALPHLTKARAAGLGDNVDLARNVRFHEAVALTRLGRFEEALAVLVAFGIEHRESPPVLDALGAATLRIAEPVEQLPPDRQEMVRRFGKAAFLAAERKLDESLKLYDELGADYAGRPNVAFVLGLAQLVIKRDPERAMQYFRTELERDPDHLPAMLRVAFQLLESGQFEPCAAMARRIAELDPGEYAGHYLQGRVLLYAREYDKAIALLEKSATLAPRLAAIRYALYEAYQRSGREQQAVRAREEFSRLDALEKQAQGEAGAPPAPESAVSQPPPPPQAAASETAAPKSPAARSAVETFEQVKARADQARENGSLPEATKLYAQLVKRRPSFTEGWWYLGSLSYEADAYAEAASAFEKVVAQDSGNSQAWGLLGLCEYRLGKNAPALEHLTRSRQLGLDRFRDISRVVRLHQAMLLNRSGQFEAAFFVLRTFATERQAVGSVVDAMGLSVLRISEPLESLSLERREMVRKFGQAALLDEDQKPEESLKLYEELEARYRGQPNVSYAFGAALLSQGQGDRALGYFKEELARDPNHYAALLQMALRMIASGQFNDGLPFATRAIEVAPGEFAGYYVLGRIRLYLGDIQGAIAQFELAAGIAPTVASIQYALSQAYRRARRPDDAARAMSRFEKLDALNKDRRGDVFISPEEVSPPAPNAARRPKLR
jgi:tetratricopeptide (TPR) repeat protein